MIELIDGCSLELAMAKYGRLSIRDCVRIATKIVDALEYASSCYGATHLALKPSNIILTGNPGTWNAMVADFGIAKLSSPKNVECSEVTTVDKVHIRQEQPADERRDIYSLGCIMYKMLTGRKATQAPNAVASTVHRSTESESGLIALEYRDSSIPFVLQKLITKCLEKDQSRGFRSIKQLKERIGK